MVKLIKNKNQALYQCAECGLKYENEEIAEKCQAWCKKHKSCNLGLIKYAVADLMDNQENRQKVDLP